MQIHVGRIANPSLKYQYKPKIPRLSDKSNIGYWSSADDWVEWRVKNPKTGVYRVTARISSRGQATPFAVELDDQRVEAESIRTGRWEEFASRADNVIVTCLKGSAKVNGKLLFPPLNPAVGQKGGGWIAGVRTDMIKSRQTIEAGAVTYHNVYSKGKGGFDSAIRVCLKGGKATAGKDGITIQDADQVALLMRIVPWKTPLPKDRSEAWAYSPQNPDFAKENLGRYVACPKLAESSVVAFADTAAAGALMPNLKASLDRVSVDSDVLFERHVALHRPLFERVRLDLGAPADQRKKSSEQLLDAAGRSGKMSLALAEKVHDAGRYMFLCCAGELPPNLQGLWTGTWKPAWSGDFTLDTNVQLAMKHGSSGNYPELMEGYYRLMESFYPEWRINAKRAYGADGFMTNARASNTALLLHWGTWPCIFWTGGCGWYVKQRIMWS